MLELIDGIYLGNAQPDSGGGSSPVIEELNVTPSTSSQIITAPSEIDGYSPVNVSAVTASIDANITAGNIKSGVSILGVDGTLEESPIKEWYNWRTESSLGTWSESSLPISESWNSIAYGDGKFVTLEGGTGSGDGYNSAYSTDGINWTSGSGLPYPCDWSSIAYGNGKFVAVQKDGKQYWGDKAVYSTDGINWTGTSMPSTQKWSSVTYGGGKFVAIASGGSGGSDKCAYSTDGINWTQSSLPSSRLWNSIAYGNGKFVAIAYNSSGSYGTKVCAYSTDGIDWTGSSLPTSGYWWSVTYGNGKFVAVGENDCAAYSTDGENWTSITMPYSSSKKWKSVAYGDGKFVAIESPNSYSSSTPPNVVAYSTDGVNWSSMSMPTVAFWNSIAFGDNKFVAVASQSDKSAYVPLTFLKVFTDTLSPTTASTVYSAPFTASALTITSVGTGTIVCSDSNVYTRNSAGDEDSVMNITQNGTYDVTQYVGAVVDVPSGGGSVITATNTTGSSISAGDKVWITPNGSGYDIVNLTKLQADFEPVGSPTIDYNTGIVSNLNNSNFIHVNKYLNSKNVELYIKLYPTSLPADATILKSAETDYSALYIRASDGYVCWYDGVHRVQVSGNYTITPNQWIWVYFKTSSNTNEVTCSTLLDNGYTLDTLPQMSTQAGWYPQFNYYNAGGIGTSQYMFNIGNYEYGFFGSVDLKNTIIKTGPNNKTIIETGVNYNGVIWQPFTEVSNLQSTSFSGYAAENIVSGSSGQVSVILSA